MDNDITKLLDIKESGIVILQVKETKTTKIVVLEKQLTFHFCPVCGCRMHSKGIYLRKVNHPIMQDGRMLILHIRQRRWICSNQNCRNIETDEFSFVDKGRRNTNLSDILILEAFKDPNMSAVAIAKKFNVSDSHVIRTFARYVDMKRRTLPEALCIDEVYTNTDPYAKYALVLQDFMNNEPVDLVRSRRKAVTQPYFSNISLKERKRVKYLITDMYDQYLRYADMYFPNATNVIDAFHVIQAINREFHRYILKDIKKLDDRDKARHEALEQELHRKIEFKHSKDYFVLKKYQWMLLKNADHLKVYTQPRYDKRLGRLMNTFDYFDWMYKIDPYLEDLRNLKETYIKFNNKYAGDPAGARKALPSVIKIYEDCPYEMFHKIAEMLRSHFDPIINSFILLEKLSGDKSRLSNGPIESLNRIAKDMKRMGRGYRNFEYLRQRFLFSQRHNATILGVPKKLEETYLAAYAPKPSDDPYIEYDEDLEDDWMPFDEF